MNSVNKRHLGQGVDFGIKQSRVVQGGTTEGEKWKQHCNWREEER